MQDFENDSYRLPDETLPGYAYAHYLDDLIDLRDFISARGIHTKNTRIERYISFMKEICSNGQCDGLKIFKNSADSRFRSPDDWLIYVLREVNELSWIYKGLSKALPIGIDEKLKILISGSDFAALDIDSASRDIQFELRIASYFCQAGCEVDVSQETDIIVLTSDRAYYIECKRIASNGKIAKRLAEARKQLANRIPKKIHGLDVFGCIAADVTKVAFPHNGLTIGLTNEHSKKIIQRKLIDIYDSVKNAPLFLDCKQLLFYWLQIHMPGIIHYPATRATRFSSYQILRSGITRKERRAAAVFYGIFEDSSNKLDPRQTPSKKLKLRREIMLPAGTTFSFNGCLMAELIGGRTVNESEQDENIGTLSIDGKDHDFFVSELERLRPQLDKGLASELASNDPQAGCLLLMKLYLQRFPYEN